MTRPRAACLGLTLLTCTPLEAASPPTPCPAGTTMHADGHAHAPRWWCARLDGVRHGPFREVRHDEDIGEEVTVWGRYRDGELDGPIDHAWFYPVLHSGRHRVFRRERFDRGARLQSNEASVVVLLDDARPRRQLRFTLRARGLTATARWAGEPDAIGVIDVDVAPAWIEPAGAASIAVTQQTTGAGATTQAATTIVHAPSDAAPSSLSTPWTRCAAEGCAYQVDVTIARERGEGPVAVTVTTRAVPDVWPDDASVEVASSLTTATSARGRGSRYEATP
ncbi:MAG: hypothetical protein R3A51_12865 [Nannocystaceae bacterium]|nr:hypothetical protein [Myxococcales bacterium]